MIIIFTKIFYSHLFYLHSIHSLPLYDTFSNLSIQPFGYQKKKNFEIHFCTSKFCNLFVTHLSLFIISSSILAMIIKHNNNGLQLKKSLFIVFFRHINLYMNYLFFMCGNNNTSFQYKKTPLLKAFFNSLISI